MKTLLIIIALIVIIFFGVIIIQAEVEHADYERVLKKYNKDVENELKNIPYERRRCDFGCKYRAGTPHFVKEISPIIVECLNNNMDDVVYVKECTGCKYYVPAWVRSEKYSFNIVE